MLHDDSSLTEFIFFVDEILFVHKLEYPEVAEYQR